MVDQSYVGRKSWPRLATPYEQYCIDEGVPVYRGKIGYTDVRDLELGDWARMGGRGAFIDLDGTGGKHGTYLVEVPPGGALEPEHHLFEEIIVVIEGRGTTEVWVDGVANKQVFEWGQYSIFSPPMNTWHRIINATNQPALLLVLTNAPPIMEVFMDKDFIFNDTFHFKSRFDPSDESYFDAWEEFSKDELALRVLYGGALVPDAAGMYLPFDGQRGYGHMRTGLRMSGNKFSGFIAEYAPGRYSKTHAHIPGAILVCLGGKGYTMNWPKSLGIHPWQDGHADQVHITEYVPGGVVSAAPGDADWYHGHFGVGGLRVLAVTHGHPDPITGAPGDLYTANNEDIAKGGNTIPYEDEDPMVRRIFKEKLDAIGAKFDMPDELYQKM